MLPVCIKTEHTPGRSTGSAAAQYPALKSLSDVPGYMKSGIGSLAPVHYQIGTRHKGGVEPAGGIGWAEAYTEFQGPYTAQPQVGVAGSRALTLESTKRSL